MTRWKYDGNDGYEAVRSYGDEYQAAVWQHRVFGSDRPWEWIVYKFQSLLASGSQRSEKGAKQAATKALLRVAKGGVK